MEEVTFRTLLISMCLCVSEFSFLSLCSLCSFPLRLAQVQSVQADHWSQPPSPFICHFSLHAANHITAAITSFSFQGHFWLFASTFVNMQNHTVCFVVYRTYLFTIAWNNKVMNLFLFQNMCYLSDVAVVWYLKSIRLLFCVVYLVFHPCRCCIIAWLDLIHLTVLFSRLFSFKCCF